MSHPTNAPPIELSNAELVAASRDGLSREQAEERLAGKIGRPFGLSAREVRAARHLGYTDLQLWADLRAARTHEDTATAKQRAEMRRRAADEAAFQNAVAQARKAI